MQEFTPIEDNHYISDGPSQINKNIQSVATDFSGSSFPTENIFVGMKCLRTDENKLYRLCETVNNKLVWVLEYSIIDGGIKVAESFKADIATTANKADEAPNYLPLLGGILTGGITTKIQTVLVRDVDNGNLQINGATSYSKGAYILLAGEGSKMAGQFNLVAVANGVTVKLVGKPDGTLTWNGKIVTVGTNTETWTCTLADGSTVNKKVVLMQ